MREKKHKVGDQAWFVPGFKGAALIAVRVTISEVDDHWKRKDPDGGLLFYWLDEPVGASLAADDLLDEDAAKQELLARYADWVHYREDGEEYVAGDLPKWREQKMGFIVGTWPAGAHPGLKEYSDKKGGVDWFNMEMLRGTLI
jgi:hypothetical protein